MYTWRVRRLAPLRFTNPRAAELSVHSTIVPGEQLHILLHWSLVAIPSQAPPTSAHQLGLARAQANHVLCLGRRIHEIPRVFNRTLYPNCNSRAAATICDVSSPISIGHHHDRTLRSARNFQEHQDCNQQSCCMPRFPIKYQQALDVDFITSGSCADVSGSVTNKLRFKCQDDATRVTNQATVCDAVVQFRPG